MRLRTGLRARGLAALVTAAAMLVPAALTTAPATASAFAQVTRVTAAAAKAAAPTATLSADRRFVKVNLDRRHRGATVTVRVRLRSTYVKLGRLKLNRNGDGRLKVPAARVKSMKAKLPVKFVKAGKTIGVASMRRTAPAKPAPRAPVPVPPVPVPPVPVPPGPASPALPEVAAQNFAGSGDQVVPLATAATRPFIATITGAGSSEFIVSAIDSTGQESALLVDEIGDYPAATLLVDVVIGETVDGFQVTATGISWTIQVRPLSAAAGWTAGQTSGEGSTVLAVGDVTAPTEITLSNLGSSDFIVSAINSTGQASDVLVDEIGDFDGVATMPVGTRYLSIESVGGSWTADRP